MKQDPHSFYVPGQPKIETISWDVLNLDFDAKRVHAKARYAFDKAGETNFDTRELDIIRISSSRGKELAFTMADSHRVKGSCLTFSVPDDLQVLIEYGTSPAASGLQWMDAKIAGGQPFAYTQGEAINARSYIPCQDTPSIKFTFSTSVRVLEALRGLIAASEHLGRSEADSGHCIERWNMPFPIPSYLIAFAVGDLVSKDISERSRIWAQPHMVDAVAAEFADIPRLMAAGEELFGPYPFGRYDVLVMPSAFPYGGMENPCLSFLTPALITGDGSGISVVAHELAHSWTGNLVTNANWDAFWLNEGWTVWAEGRIMEAVYGRDEAMLQLRLLQCEFDVDCDRYHKADEQFLTKLCHGHNDVDPDDVFSRVPYFKGAQFLRLLEETVGRERFDTFVRTYLDTFKYQSIDTETFLEFVESELGQDVLDAARAQGWVYEAGLPDNAPAVDSAHIDPVERLARSAKKPSPESGWSSSQWQLYLELLPRPVSKDFVAGLDTDFALRSASNIEVQWSFLVLAVQSGHHDVLPHVEEFLHSQGRMRYLKPLYEALAATADGHAFASKVFTKARGKYHPVAAGTVERVLFRTA